MNLSDLDVLNEFNLTDEMKQKLILFYEILISENKKYNLTAITEEKDVIDKHFYDSLTILLKENIKHKNVLDIGTGGGFPGIPLAIVSPESNFYLLEASKKKCDFLSFVINKLNLNNVTIFNTRCEDFENSYREFFDLIVTRAVSELRIISELAIPFLKVKGKFIPYKGINYLQEIENSFDTFKILDIKLVDNYHFILPCSKQDRYLLVFEKEKKTNKIYPRKYNLIKSKPLKF